MSLRFVGIRDFASEGKFLWEIVCQLREMGSGRYVTKTEWMRKWPNEPSYLKIVKARPNMDRWLQGGRLWAEYTLRGRNLGVYEFEANTNRSDWVLIHRHEEKKFTQNQNKMSTITIPDSFPLPPLQKHLARKWVQKYNIDPTSVHLERAPLELCLDPQFEMYRPLMERVKLERQSHSIYDEVEPKVFLDFYGRVLPTKVDAWSTAPATYKYRFSEESLNEKFQQYNANNKEFE